MWRVGYGCGNNIYYIIITCICFVCLEQLRVSFINNWRIFRIRIKGCALLPICFVDCNEYVEMCWQIEVQVASTFSYNIVMENDLWLHVCYHARWKFIELVFLKLMPNNRLGGTSGKGNATKWLICQVCLVGWNKFLTVQVQHRRSK